MGRDSSEVEPKTEHSQEAEGYPNSRSTTTQ